MNEAESRWATLARLAIEAEVGESPDPQALADASDRLSLKLSGQLSLLVGVQGFRAILSLALHRSQEHFPLLEEVQVSEGGATLLGLLPMLGSRDTAMAKEAVVDVLACALGVLADLIGAHLLRRYLLMAWPRVEGAAGPNPDTADNGE